MHKLPEKLTGGWRHHVQAHNELLEYAHKTHPIPAHGYRQTINGTMPRRPYEQQTAQFTPFISTGANPKCQISPGVIYSQYIDDAQADSSTTQSTNRDFPHLQNATIEPTINGTKLSADKAPALAITYPGNNYIYLKLTWKAYRSKPAGILFTGNYNLVPTYPAGTQTDQKDGTNPLPSSKQHNHTIPGGTTSGDMSIGDASSGANPGMILDINCILYSLSAAEFFTQADQAPPTETEFITYLPAGYISLDANGEITKFGTDDGLRWFLNGAIKAWRDKQWVAGTDGDPDDGGRVEPVAPNEPEEYTMPGQETDA